MTPATGFARLKWPHHATRVTGTPRRKAPAPSSAAVQVEGRGGGDTAGPGGDLERGSATVWLLLIVPVLVLAIGLVVDGGRALAARQQGAALAAQAARAAVDRMDTGGYRTGAGLRAVAPGSAQAAACGWVASARPDAGCTAAPGPDGTMTVTVTITYTPVVLTAAGVGPRLATATAVARPAIGADQEVDAP